MPVNIFTETHQGQEVLIMENVDPTHEEAVDGFARIHDEIMKAPDDTVRFVLDASRSNYYSDISDKWKEAAPRLNPKVISAAVVTESFPIRMAVKAFLVFTRTMRSTPFRDVAVFARKEDAVNHVASATQA